MYEILLKSNDFSLRYGDLTISKWKPSAILDFKICGFCHVAFVGMPFCFLIQTFAEIEQSVHDLWL